MEVLRRFPEGPQLLDPEDDMEVLIQSFKIKLYNFMSATIVNDALFTPHSSSDAHC